MSGGGNDDQPFASLSLTRDLGASYVQLSASAIDSGNTLGLVNFVPASTRQISLAGGTSIGSLGLDAYVSKGWRKFDDESFVARDIPLTITGNGDSFGVGGGLTYDFLVGTRDFLSPRLAVDFSRLDTGRAVALPNGEFVNIKQKEQGTTGSLGLTWQHLIGEEYEHNAGISLAAVTSSNANALVARDNPTALTRITSFRDRLGGPAKDSWVEIGIDSSFRLSEPLRLSLSGLRTIGFDGPESTSLAAGLSLSF